jgi:hypothetical protein
MYITVFLLFGTMLVALGWAANATRSTPALKAAWSPYNVLLVLLAVFVLDFAFLSGIGYTTIFRGGTAVYDDQIVWSFVVFFTFGLCAIVGMHAARLPLLTPTVKRLPTGVVRFHILLWTIPAAVIVAVIYRQTGGNLLAMQYSRQVILREIPAVYLCSYVTLAAAVYWAASARFKLLDLTVLAFYSIALFSFGGRSFLLLVIVALAINVCNKKGWMPGRLSLIFAVPILVLAISASYFFLREDDQSSGFFGYVSSQGGVVDASFGTADISLADALHFSTLYDGPRSIQNFLLGPLLFPVPRSLMSEKPEGTSTNFTRYFDPLRWALTGGSQVVTTGFGDVYINAGYLLGIPIIIAVFWWFGRNTIMGFRAGGPGGIYLVVFTLYWLYVFIRSDVFNLAPTLWIVAGLHFYFRVLVAMLPVRQKSPRLSPAGKQVPVGLAPDGGHYPVVARQNPQ